MPLVLHLERHAMNSKLQELVRKHLTAENAHDMAGTLATLHPECVFDDTATGQMFHGLAGAEKYYRLWWSAFEITVHRAPQDTSYWSEDGTYIAKALFRGRHVGEFLNIPATGNGIEFRGVVFVTFRDGLMAGEQCFYDLSGICRQLGVFDLRAVKVLSTN